MELPTDDSIQPDSDEYLTEFLGVDLELLHSEIQSFQGLWSDDDDRPWYLKLFFMDIDGHPQCVGMEMRSFRWPNERSYHSEGEGAGSLLNTDWEGKVRPERLTSGVLRELNVSGLIRGTKRGNVKFERWVARHDKERAARLAEQAARWEQSSKASGGRPRRWTSQVLQRVAETYLRAHDHGESVLRAVADEFDITEAQAGQVIRRARRAGFLGPTQQGKAGP